MDAHFNSRLFHLTKSFMLDDSVFGSNGPQMQDFLANR